ncbi:hypothetical protein HXX76_014265 [Chlamydomonas incerta]|uniref:Protein kinase domain-containing protein n=1 Tax=Chlamydomonas incerta TaxID=51695 RepID=A0A835SCZ9_CHLIN|nr:hypothetical protein HXX76_014265 [Chlamydomonas incerta]|eukprot:KAG2424689.1 hypothetical protein HXX76_014265 [Chlamydomonas incerta]
MGIGQTWAATDTSGNGGASSASSSAAPPLALLLDTTVTCDSAASVQTDGAGDAQRAQQAGTADSTVAGAATTPNGTAGSTAGGTTAPYAPSGPPGPWDCIATTVSNSEELATMPDLVAGAADSAHVFITVEAGSPVRVDNATWRTMSVKVTLVVYILGRGRHVSTLDLAGLAQGRFADVDSDFTSQGLLAMYDLTLTGLSYPTRAVQHHHLLAAWAHAVALSGVSSPRLIAILGRIAPIEVMLRLSNVRLEVAAAEADWWRNIARKAAGGAGQELFTAGKWLGTSQIAVTAVVTLGSIDGASVAGAGASSPNTTREVGPLDWSYYEIWSFEDCWVAPVPSRHAAMAAVGAPGTAEDTSVASAAAAPTLEWESWPLADALGAALASTLPFGRLGMSLGLNSVYEDVLSQCRGAAGGGPTTVVMPPADSESWLPMFGGNAVANDRLRRRERLGVSMLPLGSYWIRAAQYSMESLNPEVWLGGRQNGSGVRCLLHSPPAAQAAPGPVTWDMMDQRDRVHIRVGPAGSQDDGLALEIQGFTLYNLSPYGIGGVPPPELLQPALQPDGGGAPPPPPTGFSGFTADGDGSSASSATLTAGDDSSTTASGDGSGDGTGTAGGVPLLGGLSPLGGSRRSRRLLQLGGGGICWFCNLKPNTPLAPPCPPAEPPIPPSPPSMPPSPPAPPSPPPPLLPSLPLPPPPDPTDPFHGLSLSLPFFKFDRFNPLLYKQQQQQPSASSGTGLPSRLPPLALVSCTLVVPPPELELLRGLLLEVGKLQAAAVRRHGRSALEAADGGAGSGSSSDSSGWTQAVPTWPAGVPPASGPDVPLPVGLLECPRALLLSYVAVAEVAQANATAISFARFSFMGWSGQDVVVTSQLPDDAPTRLSRSAAGLQRPLFSAQLEVRCALPVSPPSPQPPEELATQPSNATAAAAAVGAPAGAAAPASSVGNQEALIKPDAAAPADSSGQGTSAGESMLGAAALVPSSPPASAPSAGDSSGSDGTDKPAWVVPVAATVGGVVGALLLLIVPLVVLLRRRHRQRMEQHQQHQQKHFVDATKRCDSAAKGRLSPPAAGGCKAAAAGFAAASAGARNACSARSHELNMEAAGLTGYIASSMGQQLRASSSTSSLQRAAAGEAVGGVTREGPYSSSPSSVGRLATLLNSLFGIFGVRRSRGGGSAGSPAPAASGPHQNWQQAAQSCSRSSNTSTSTGALWSSSSHADGPAVGRVSDAALSSWDASLTSDGYMRNGGTSSSLPLCPILESVGGGSELQSSSSSSSSSGGGGGGHGGASRQRLTLTPACRVSAAWEGAVLQASTAPPVAADAGATANSSELHQQLSPTTPTAQDAQQDTTACEQLMLERDEELWLERVIGRGSFGVVYLGIWRGLRVAVKILVVHEALLGDEGRQRQRAVLEAAVSSSLSHACLVQTYAFDVRKMGELPVGSTGAGGGGMGANRGRRGAPPTLEMVAEEGEDEPAQGAAAVATTHDGSPDADAVYQLLLIQAYCDGGSLWEGISTYGLYMGMAPDSRGGALLGLCLALDVAAGMAHVHARGIVHGDLSSGNVLLSARPPPADNGAIDGARDDAAEAEAEADPACLPTSATAPDVLSAAGEEEAVAAAAEAAARQRTRRVMQPPVIARIADFGLSARMGEGQTHASDCCQGTPIYMAPEVTVEGRLGKAADVYSFGVILLELLTGKTAGAGLLSAVAAMAPAGAAGSGSGGGGRAAAGPPTMASLLPDGCSDSEPLVGMLKSCLSPKPQDRPTFPQVLHVLGAVIAELDAY